jgi:hypothetical protein
VRISIMVGGSSSRPDTLKQTGSAANLDNPLADGAGHTFKIIDDPFVLSRMAGPSAEKPSFCKRFPTKRSWNATPNLSAITRSRSIRRQLMTPSFSRPDPFRLSSPHFGRRPVSSTNTRLCAFRSPCRACYFSRAPATSIRSCSGARCEFYGNGKGFGSANSGQRHYERAGMMGLRARRMNHQGQRSHLIRITGRRHDRSRDVHSIFKMTLDHGSAVRTCHESCEGWISFRQVLSSSGV